VRCRCHDAYTVRHVPQARCARLETAGLRPSRDCVRAIRITARVSDNPSRHNDAKQHCVTIEFFAGGWGPIVSPFLSARHVELAFSKRPEHANSLHLVRFHLSSLQDFSAALLDHRYPGLTPCAISCRRSATLVTLPVLRKYPCEIQQSEPRRGARE
jgi:hypothetical protein